MNRLEMGIMMIVHVIAGFPFSNTDYTENRLLLYSRLSLYFESDILRTKMSVSSRFRSDTYDCIAPEPIQRRNVCLEKRSYELYLCSRYC